MQTLNIEKVWDGFMYKLCSSLLKYSLFVLPDMTEPLTRVITPLGSLTLFYQWFAFFTVQEPSPIILIINIL